MSSLTVTLDADTLALLDHECKTIGKDQIHAPCPDFLDRCFVASNQPPQVLRALGSLYGPLRTN